VPGDTSLDGCIPTRFEFNPSGNITGDDDSAMSREIATFLINDVRCDVEVCQSSQAIHDEAETSLAKADQQRFSQNLAIEYRPDRSPMDEMPVRVCNAGLNSSTRVCKV